MLRLRPCGGKAPASVHALFRARLPRPASSTAYAVAASSALEELAAERKGHGEWHHVLNLIVGSEDGILCGSTGELAFYIITLEGQKGIDSSGSALDLASENIVLNELSPGKISFIKGDATAFMKGAISKNELWDLVILDPPKLAPLKKVLYQGTYWLRQWA